MKWLKKNKQNIIFTVQSSIVLYVMTYGFSETYLWIWFNAGLPIKWWSLVITLVLGVLSTIGLFAWIKKETNDE